VFVVAFLTTPAFGQIAPGLIDASLNLGVSGAGYSNSGREFNLQGTAHSLAVHVHPVSLPFVNLGFGLAITLTKVSEAPGTGFSGSDQSSPTGNGNSSDYFITSSDGLDLSPEVTATLKSALPLVPYLKLGYSVLNRQSITFQNVTTQSEYSAVKQSGGFMFGFGGKFPIQPKRLWLLAEFSKMFATMATDSRITDEANPIIPDEGIEYTLGTVHVGLEMLFPFN
jgi:hypothetical protein